MSNTHPGYVCDRCNFTHFHPLSYCPKCPGRMHRRQIAMPQSSKDCKTEAEFHQFIRAQGLDYIGEFPKIDPEIERAATLARYQERLDAAKRDNIPKLIDYWTKQIEGMTL